MPELCRICETRRPRRYCPGVRGDICSICCGTEREVSVDCPFECEYLQEARAHEKPPEVDPKTFPNADIRVTESFLREHEPLLMFAAMALFRASMETPAVVDTDVREALDALIRTYRTAQSGLIYQTRPNNVYAAAVQARWQQSLEEFRQQSQRQAGMATLRDTEVLGVLVFLQQLELQNNNGRRRGRAFLDFLRSYFGAAPNGPEASPLMP